MPRNYFNLEGKVALITGASSGLGVHFANVLAAEGATVILAARRAEKLAEEVSSIKSGGGKACSVEMDVAKPDSVRSAFEWISHEFGAIDILINNAGFGLPGAFVELGGDVNGILLVDPINANVV